MRRLLGLVLVVLLVGVGACGSSPGEESGPDEVATAGDGGGSVDDRGSEGTDSGTDDDEDGGGSNGTRGDPGPDPGPGGTGPDPGGPGETGPDPGGPGETGPDPGGPGFNATTNEVLIGSGGLVSLPTPYSFGSVPPGSSVTRTLTVGAPSSGRANDEGPTFVRMEVRAETGHPLAFTIDGHTCNGVRFFTTKCTVTITATPPGAGRYAGVVEVEVSEGRGGSTGLEVFGNDAAGLAPGPDTTSSNPGGAEYMEEPPG